MIYVATVGRSCAPFHFEFGAVLRFRKRKSTECFASREIRNSFAPRCLLRHLFCIRLCIASVTSTVNENFMRKFACGPLDCEQFILFGRRVYGRRGTTTSGISSSLFTNYDLALIDESVTDGDNQRLLFAGQSTKPNKFDFQLIFLGVRGHVLRIEYYSSYFVNIEIESIHTARARRHEHEHWAAAVALVAMLIRFKIAANKFRGKHMNVRNEEKRERDSHCQMKIMEEREEGGGWGGGSIKWSMLRSELRRRRRWWWWCWWRWSRNWECSLQITWIIVFLFIFASAGAVNALLSSHRHSCVVCIKLLPFTFCCICVRVASSRSHINEREPTHIINNKNQIKIVISACAERLRCMEWTL